MRQQAFFDACDENIRKFQPLRAVERHERDEIRVRVMCVNIRDESDFLQK